MELKIKLIGGSSAGKEVAITVPQFLIGRADECQLRPKSETVSRRHALIEAEELKVQIRDLGSRTGTFVNGKPITPKQPVELATGNTVKIGPIEFEVLIKFSVSGKKKSKVESVEEAASRTAGAATGEEVDVSQWLMPTDEETSLSATIDGSRTGTILSAADLLGSGLTDAEAAAEAERKKAAAGAPPDQAASDMLKNYLRRR